MSAIYIEAFSGLSGDMFLGTLAGLAEDHDILEKLPKMLNLEDAQIKITEVNKNGIVCKHVCVVDLNTQVKQSNHRHLTDIIKIIEESRITDNAKKIAKDIFLIIGKSESKIHNIPLEKIHFHEVSGVDSIIDIVGCAVLIDQLKISKVYATPVCTGYGFVDTQHGKLPVPAPATADILSGIPQYRGDEKGERITPTGAAILKYLNPIFELPVLRISKTVYAAGSKDFISPNVLRISICEVQNKLKGSYILETNIDDMSNELLGNEFQEGLFNHGASDFYYSHIHMKKGRPGILLSCNVPGDKIQKLSDYIFNETSTIGMRYYAVKGIKLDREIKMVSTPYGKVKVKIAYTPSGKIKSKIEFDDLKAISKRSGVSIYDLQKEITELLIQKTIN